MNTLTASHYRQAFDYISGAVDDVGARRLALERFLAQGLPDVHDEDWKYTRLDHLDTAPLHAPILAAAPARGTPPDARPSGGLAQHPLSAAIPDRCWLLPMAAW